MDDIKESDKSEDDIKEDNTDDKGLEDSNNINVMQEVLDLAFQILPEVCCYQVLWSKYGRKVGH